MTGFMQCCWLLDIRRLRENPFSVFSFRAISDCDDIVSPIQLQTGYEFSKGLLYLVNIVVYKKYLSRDGVKKSRDD